jgi:hypothetical protein
LTFVTARRSPAEAGLRVAPCRRRRELGGNHRGNPSLCARAHIGRSAGVKSNQLEPFEGEPQAQERLPDDLWDGREVLQWGLWRDHAERSSMGLKRLAWSSDGGARTIAAPGRWRSRRRASAPWCVPGASLLRSKRRCSADLRPTIAVSCSPSCAERSRQRLLSLNGGLRTTERHDDANATWHGALSQDRALSVPRLSSAPSA